jgi:hypothetical protein
MRRTLVLGLLAFAVTGVASSSPGRSDPPRRLRDGIWYGKIVSVNVAQRRLTFAPACRLNDKGRWIAVADRSRTTVSVSRHAALATYYRPNGDASRGHGQEADLRELADVARHGRLPDFPQGWFVKTHQRLAVSVEEASGVRSSGTADRRTFACVWSAATQAFVGH